MTLEYKPASDTQHYVTHSNNTYDTTATDTDDTVPYLITLKSSLTQHINPSSLLAEISHSIFDYTVKLWQSLPLVHCSFDNTTVSITSSGNNLASSFKQAVTSCLKQKNTVNS